MTSNIALSLGTHTISVPHGTSVIEQRYHVAGSGPVCLVHPGGPGIGWDYLRMPDLERSMTMIYVEPVGTGASGRLADPRGYNLGLYTHFLHAIVEHLDLPEVMVLGHSHGGFVAQRYALDHPDRVASLILYDTSPVTGEVFWSAAVENMERYARRHVADHPEVASYVAGLTGETAPSDDEGATEVLRRISPAYFHDYWGHEAEFTAGRQALRMYAAPAWGEGPAFDVREELHTITAPTLVLVGDDDFICGVRWARMIHEAVPGSQLAVLDRTGHLGHIESPGQFAGAVAAFLDAVTVGGS
ncbi:alpha/beta fold hydrolase [Promicromonospora kroppenstedtii]|uniref:alpha/beta fold hydrolase n=1 Tax=Promicromonospora kroppenstedtii TaxID=440482 RepID=UPI0004AD41A2|nr:alpha/beta hydrolase [Promicromonospora kroppenstedtii]